LCINDRIQQIKEDEEQINKFVEEYKPFIASCTEKVTRRYVRYGEDDELSIALIAFVEAIRSFDASRGKFLSFAQNVIKRRLIDYYRKERKHQKVVSLNDYCSEEFDDDGDLSAAESVNKYSEAEISEYRRLELEELKVELGKWDISFFDVAEASPKRGRTRRICKEIIDFIVSRPELAASIRKKKYLPIAEIEKSIGSPRKNIERARKYIIAAVIIRTGDYQYIKDYVSWDV
jgi:RNA polymerase sigma factor